MFLPLPEYHAMKAYRVLRRENSTHIMDGGIEWN
jgi:hypothetical protein